MERGVTEWLSRVGDIEILKLCGSRGWDGGRHPLNKIAMRINEAQTPANSDVLEDHRLKKR